MDREGRIIVLTGDGKGKTTSALGMAMRGLGWGRKVCILQFFKSLDYDCGERIFLEKLGCEIYPLGIGFSWLKSEKEQREALKKAWDMSLLKLSDDYDMVILDEIINVFSQKNINIDDILTEKMLSDTVKKYSLNKDIILTGRGCPKSIIDIADTVTEMVNIKHGYEKGIKACKGVEF
ncbi:hypothetical protein B5E58_06535 [Tyzzerella sp. An114]|uniref:cob(I)yrinic acid a,c-diamide adenosyltransferase n=1 Tax=Tyzzerella sp. An114 TaxID=1965545 RepID=UPI000B44917C|nr:cob(I)yrinic acid a,c-diamide adenosyltransferase [Tyzzerella sp. An114]OUQ58833.1 hypothetical protein B5E58_06535 [Tyzzerella sp. An114]HIT72423.1 cob(I)yrinic acid a,c-diamide adenosyltransferase [Candidatus Fimicola cottocaccae]